MEKQTDFAVYITRFFNQYLTRERNLSKNTIASYSRIFSFFLKYVASKLGINADSFTLKDFTRDNVLLFLDHIESDNGNSISTRNQRLAAFQSFATFLLTEKPEDMVQWQRIKRIPLKKGGKRDTIKHLSKEEVKILMGIPDTDTKEGLRALAILVALYGLALRVQECADLTVSSLFLQNKPYTVKVHGKGNKYRVLAVLDEDKNILERYLKAYGLDSPEKSPCPLFTNRSGEKLTRAGITYILDQLLRAARQAHPDMFLEKYSCHSLRHSRAMHMVEVNVHPVHIRDYLGHASLTTTDIYAKASSKAKQEALKKASEGIVPTMNDSDRIWEHDSGVLEWLTNLGKQ